jgi:hypothetical protein
VICTDLTGVHGFLAKTAMHSRLPRGPSDTVKPPVQNLWCDTGAQQRSACQYTMHTQRKRSHQGLRVPLAPGLNRTILHPNRANTTSTSTTIWQAYLTMQHQTSQNKTTVLSAITHKSPQKKTKPAKLPGCTTFPVEPGRPDGKHQHHQPCLGMVS